jgi:hypothetical protein
MRERERKRENMRNSTVPFKDMYLKHPPKPYFLTSSHCTTMGYKTKHSMFEPSGTFQIQTIATPFSFSLCIGNLLKSTVHVIKRPQNYNYYDTKYEYK